MNIFESAVHKLTAWYVGALFIVCLVFSVPTYIVASNQLQHGALRQAEIIQELDRPLTGPLGPRLNALREQQIQRDRNQLLRTIVFANITILVLGAYLSYRFAKRTLQPIEEAHEAQTRFTTDASHELRTPLATMQTEIEVALRGKKFNTGQARQVLGSNLEEIARLRNLSEELLALARLDSSQLKKTSVPISKIATDEINSIESRHHLKITQNIQKGLTVQGDERLLRQLIEILADNAVKYSGDKPADIMVSLKKSDSSALLSITDRGIGIKASELPHVFERFYRGSSATKHNSEGHGLGLSLAKRIVDIHDGTITASSQPGKSTTFDIRLPS